MEVHDTNGVPHQVSVPTGDVCEACAEAAEVGFGRLRIDELEQLLSHDEQCRESFREARGHCMGDLLPNWGEETADQTKAFGQSLKVRLSGWTKAQFEKMHPGRDIYQMCLAVTEVTHPLTAKTEDVFWMPAEGPAYVMEIAARDQASWSLNCMPRQVHSKQGDQTLEYLRQQLPAQALSVCFSGERAKLMQQQRSCGASVPGGGRAGSSSGASPGNAWAKSAQVQAASGRSMVPLVPRPAGVVAGKDVKPGGQVVPASRPNVSKAAGLHDRLALAGLRQSSLVSTFAKHPTTPTRSLLAHKLKRDQATAALDTASLASTRAGKAPRCAPSPSKSASHSSMSQTRLHPRPLNLMGPTSGSVPSDVASRPSLGGCKFKRAMSAIPLAQCMEGVIFYEQKKQLKKMTTTCFNERGNEHPLCHELVDYSTYVGFANDLAWCHMRVNTWKHAIECHEGLATVPMEKLPHKPYGYYAGRRAIEFTPPRNQKFEPNQFWDVMAIHKPDGAKPDYSVKAPTLWCTYFQTAQQLHILPLVLDDVITDAMLAPVMKSGVSGRDLLLSYCISIIRHTNAYPEELKMAIDKTRVKCFCLLMLLGTEPFQEGASLEAVEKAKGMKGDRFHTELMNQENTMMSAALAKVYTQNLAEVEHWPTIKQHLSDLENGGDVEEISKIAITKWPVWTKTKVRASILEKLGNSCAECLVAKMTELFPASSTAETITAGQRTLVRLLQRAAALWESPALEASLDQYSSFAATIMASDLKSKVIALAGSLADSSGDQARIAKAAKEFVVSPGTRVVFKDNEDVSQIVNCYTTLNKSAGQNFPENVEAATLLALLNERIDLSEGATANGMQNVKAVAVAIIRFYDASSLYKSYMALGASAIERVNQDKPSMKHALDLMAKHKELGRATFDDKFVEAVGAKEAEMKQLLKDCAIVIQEHGIEWVQMGKPVVMKSLEELAPSSKGSANAESWKANLSSDSTWSDVCLVASSTVANVVPAEFIKLIRTLHQVSHLCYDFHFCLPKLLCLGVRAISDYDC